MKFTKEDLKKIKGFLEEGEITTIMKCPKCYEITIRKMDFDDYPYPKKEDTNFLHICSCVSGGIYSIYFNCPNCNEEIEIY